MARSNFSREVKSLITQYLAAGTNVTLTYNSSTDKLDIASSGGSGGVSDGDKGDITVSGSGATWTIDARAVTFGKMPSVTDNRLLGRSAGSAGDTQEITVGSGLSLSGGTLSSTVSSGLTHPQVMARASVRF